MYHLVFTKQALKDAQKIEQAKLRPKVERMLREIKQDPWVRTYNLEKLTGEMKGAYSKRIDLHNRLVYQIFTQEKIVRILRMWTHYE